MKRTALGSTVCRWFGHCSRNYGRLCWWGVFSKAGKFWERCSKQATMRKPEVKLSSKMKRTTNKRHTDVMYNKQIYILRGIRESGGCGVEIGKKLK